MQALLAERPQGEKVSHLPIDDHNLHIDKPVTNLPFSAPREVPLQPDPAVQPLSPWGTLIVAMYARRGIPMGGCNQVI